MATKSILKTVHIKDPRSARKLVNALESSEKHPSKTPRIKQKVTTATREEIRNMFDKTE